MMTTSDLIAEIQISHGNCTRYRVSKLLGTATQSIYTYALGKTVMVDEIGLKAASLLGLPEEYVLACLQAERTKGYESHRHWLRIAEQLTPQSRRKSA